jgi:signal transduction histidine kinase
MISENAKILNEVNQVLLSIIEGKMSSALELCDNLEPTSDNGNVIDEIIINIRTVIQQYIQGAEFLNTIANGNLDVSPPDDPLRQNYLIAQCKQLHSNLRHLTWQTQQIAKGDLKQKVSFLGELSISFNNMIEALREKKQLETKLAAQNEELQQLNATKDKFFSIIGHDLKGPFNAIVGYSHLLVEQVSEKDYEGIEEYAGIILKSSERAMDLLTNLIVWSRSQTGRMEFNPQKLDMISIIGDVVALLSDTARQKGIILTQKTDPVILMYADSAMMATVLRNLVSNAIKFTNSGGEIVISAAAKHNKLTVSVADSGIGISTDRLEKLFRIDESYSTPGTNNEQGTGLGLILCKDFIEKHTGTIWVESDKGKGSTFYFTTPCNTEF